jgi:hypothetical protein
VSASRKLGRSNARELAAAASRVIVAKGRKVQQFEPCGAPDDTVLDAMVGATGNLRAPLLRVDKTLLVGFDADSYAGVLG